MSGFPFHKLAPLPWKVMPGGTGISCSDEKGSKVCATRAGHAFPERGERESIALAKEIALVVNSHDDMLAALKSADETLDECGYSEFSAERATVRAAIAKAENA
ncbi:hypothetical protein [Mesorhizobium sp.]|uniref:hypothetical protein n=1 Tax=Mesorhizobium sp. TaxID=1871066 RepID=UPI0012160BAE|nr:hypothetical protein [Mesorhizobium sp.]TIL34274.1 MAG: hypothetical protein E5Y85_11065 [Mesorhizobium sp.]TIM09178.1 MAG: hypothetical protein E5Y62_13560 [Mesorhizobium sp.]